MSDDVIEIISEETTVVEVIAQGPQGYAEGLAAGDDEGQILRKASDADYDTEWVDEGLNLVDEDGWVYNPTNSGTSDTPENGDWRTQLQPHDTLSGVTNVSLLKVS